VKIFFIIFTAILLIAVSATFFFMRRPGLSQYEYLRNPQIRFMENQPVIVVEANGDPNEVGGKAFSLLFKTYFKIKGAQKGPKQPAPRARWPLELETKKTEWKGLYAMPVPQKTAELPMVKTQPGLTVRLDTWEYGQVAEILHIGTYDSEKATISRLAAFINKNGYTIIGDHEEEYIKGPGKFLKGNPEKYLTIIRYRVQKGL